MEKVKEKVIMVAIQLEEEDLEFSYNLEELERLIDTAQGEVVAKVTQKREKIDSRTMIGKGKLEELSFLVNELAPDLVVFYQSLTGAMVRNIGEIIGVRVIDRVQLILDIFAMRARSREGKLQVQLAQLNYLLPRLAGQGIALSRLGGGIGTRGPGETKLETDRRHIRRQISEIERELKELEQHRERSRQKRQASPVFQVGLVGYTNAGKSTLLNQLTKAETYEENQLFATLDPLTRKIDFPYSYEFTLTDTVGFIQDIPTTLIHAFQSTLEESKNVDLLLQVVDASYENFVMHEKTVQAILLDLGMEKIPLVTIYNKMDLASKNFVANSYPNLQISAKKPKDIERLREFLLETIKEVLQPYQLSFAPHEQGKMVKLQQSTLVETLEYDEEQNCYVMKGYAKESGIQNGKD